MTNEMVSLIEDDYTTVIAPTVEILMFYERDLAITTEIGIRVDDKIYVTRGDYLTTEELRDIVVTKRYILNIPNSYKCIIRDRISIFTGSEMDSEITPINSPIVMIYEIFEPYDNISLVDKGQAYDIFTHEDIEKFDFIKQAEKFNENAFKHLDDFDVDEYMADMELDILPEEILQELNIPINGYKFAVQNKNDFDRLVKRYKNNKIPEYVRDNVLNYIAESYSKFDIDTNPIESADNIDTETIEGRLDRYSDDITVSSNYNYIKKMIVNAQSMDDLEVCDYEISKVTNSKDLEQLISYRDLKEVQIKTNNLDEF